MNAEPLRPLIEQGVYRTLSAYGTKPCREDIEDLAQETLLALWRKRPVVPSERRRPYVLRTAINVALDDLRSRRAKRRAAQATTSLRECLSLPAAEPLAEQVLVDREELRHVVRLLRRRLSPLSFQIVYLRLLLGLSAKEAAATLAVSPDRVHMAVHRARKAIDVAVGTR